MPTSNACPQPGDEPASKKRNERQHKAENRIDPKKVKIGKIEYWRVRIGSRFTGDFEKATIQKYFRDEGEAKTYIRQQLALIKNHGTAAYSLTDEQRVAATDAIKRLTEVGATLREAVDYFLLHAKPSGGVVTFSSACESFLNSRKAMNCKPGYLVNLKSQNRILNELLERRNVNEIKKKELESWLALRAEEMEWEPKTRNNYIVTLRAMWTHFVDEKWCSENIATPLDKAILDDVPASIFTPDEARRLLITASKCFGGIMAAPLAIGLFAGLRRSELCKLEWSEVRTTSIEVTAAKAKTRRRRIVDIQPNLQQWLALHRKKSGPVFDGNEDKFEEKRKHIADEAGIKWTRNVLRHSAASYHLAAFSNENHTALQMGHSPQVLVDHYREVVTKEAAAQFWALDPSILP